MNMDIPKFIHGTYENLPDTLAKRVSFLRNSRGIHIFELSKRARVSVDFIEQIEAGIETWLSISIRQRISRVLKVDPNILEEVEKKIVSPEILKKIPDSVIKKIKQKIMDGEKNTPCPACGKPMRVWVQEGFDLIGNSTSSPKGYCRSCIFQIKTVE